jgi:hypothetical protein
MKRRSAGKQVTLPATLGLLHPAPPRATDEPASTESQHLRRAPSFTNTPEIEAWLTRMRTQLSGEPMPIEEVRILLDKALGNRTIADELNWVRGKA